MMEQAGLLEKIMRLPKPEHFLVAMEQKPSTLSLILMVMEPVMALLIIAFSIPLVDLHEDVFPVRIVVT